MHTYKHLGQPLVVIASPSSLSPADVFNQVLIPLTGAAGLSAHRLLIRSSDLEEYFRPSREGGESIFSSVIYRKPPERTSSPHYSTQQQ